MARKTQSTVALNAKVSSINMMAVGTDGSQSFLEGAPFARDTTTGKAILPTGGDTFQAVYCNFVDSSRSDIAFSQGDPTDDAAPSRSIQGGGLTGLVGSGGYEIGLAAASWDGGALPTVGHMVTVTTTKFKAIAVGATMNHGIVTRIEQGYAFFLFRSVPGNGA